MKLTLIQIKAQQIKDWLQGHRDTIKRIAKLQISIQRTNLTTNVSIELAGGAVIHCIAEWILRRRELAELERQAYTGLTDRGIKEGVLTQSDGTKVDIKIVRFYDPSERDKCSEAYRSEPSIIDRTLETINATTDLIET